MAKAATYTEFLKKLHGMDSKRPISQKKGESNSTDINKYDLCLRSTA